MKVQLKYFYYCSIVIMVSRLGDGSLGSVWITDRCRHSFFPEKVEFFFSNFFCNQYESSIEVFLLLFYCYNGIPFRGWGQCGLRIDVDIVFFRKKLNFFFQFFSVINMKVQLKYFYYCSIVIMVSRLGDWALGSV